MSKPNVTTKRSQFDTDLEQVVKAELRRQCTDGTVAIGRECLWGCVARHLSHMPSAPKGTNAIYYAKETFNEVCDRLATKMIL